MPFGNVNLTYGNFSFGPDAGRAYSIDHVTDTMIVKTYPGGTLVSTLPLDVGINNEVLELEYDGFYFWTLSRLGSDGSLGIVINKWLIDSGTLKKQTGAGNEINLINTGSIIYDSEAFCVHRIQTFLTSFASIGATQIQVGSTLFLEIGDSIYLGPSTASLGERQERRVTGISGNTVFLNAPLTVQFNNTDRIIYRKNIWMFNNKNGLSDAGGMLIQINSYNGLVLTAYSSCEWKYVTAATCANGNLCFVRGSQLLYYRPIGINAGYQSSAMLLNIKNDNNTIIKVSDIEIDSTTVHKLQKEQHIYNTLTNVYDDIVGDNNNYHVDTEITAAKVQSITATRSKSVFFGALDLGDFTIKVRDQYDIPILGRSISITENDVSGLISAGFTSFVTNALGEGVTRYSTGAAPNFSQPLITVRDVGTNLRLNFLLEQFQNSVGNSDVVQDRVNANPTQVEQLRTISSNTVDQYGSLRNEAPVEQLTPSNFQVLLEQDLEYSEYVIEQIPKPSNSTLIDQNTPLQEPTTVIQYNFLLFAVPAPYSKKNAANTNILVRIIGFGASPLNASTLVFKVNGVDVTGQVVITPFGGGLQLDYNPLVDFPYSSTVSVYIEIQDTNLPPRTIKTFYTFDIVGDFKTPFLSSVYPPDNSINNLPDTEVFAIIGDLETGIDLATIEFFIGGKTVPTVNTLLDSGFVKVSYTTSTNYPYEADMSAAVRAKDKEGNEFIGSWNFKIKPSSGVLFINNSPEECSVLVPVDTDVCIEVFGLEDGVNLNNLSFSVGEKNITYVLKPKVYRKE
jgi:hypothetical protein